MAPSVSTRGTRGPETPPAGAPGESVSHPAAYRSAGPPGPAGPPVRGPAAPALPPAIPCGLALHAHHPADPARAPCAPGLPKAVSTRSEAAARTAYPGQSVQVDVKHLKTQSGRLYQFTAIDEATRYRVLKIYDHNSIQSAIQFINEVRQAFPVAIRRIQTDNGSEWGTDFTWHLHDLGIAHKPIPPGCPESNGKVERSHRTDESEFYRRVTFRTRSELVRKLRAWEHEYNHRRLHLALGGKTPAERLAELRIAPAAGVLRSA